MQARPMPRARRSVSPLGPLRPRPCPNHRQRCRPGCRGLPSARPAGGVDAAIKECVARSAWGDGTGGHVMMLCARLTVSSASVVSGMIAGGAQGTEVCGTVSVICPSLGALLDDALLDEGAVAFTKFLLSILYLFSSDSSIQNI